jgi:hypothetical protein
VSSCCEDRVSLFSPTFPSCECCILQLEEHVLVCDHRNKSRDMKTSGPQSLSNQASIFDEDRCYEGCRISTASKGVVRLGTEKRMSLEEICTCRRRQAEKLLKQTSYKDLRSAAPSIQDLYYITL